MWHAPLLRSSPGARDGGEHRAPRRLPWLKRPRKSKLAGSIRRWRAKALAKSGNRLTLAVEANANDASEVLPGARRRRLLAVAAPGSLYPAPSAGLIW